MTTIFCSHDEDDFRKQRADLKVLIYGNTASPSYGVIGNQISDQFLKNLPAPPSVQAVDFLTLALGVIAADTFILRKDAADCWARDIRLVVQLAKPQHWNSHVKVLEKALQFLSGDNWKFELQPNGYAPKLKPQSFPDVDCICLLSGGLDSLIGAIDLLGRERAPLFVSHAYRGDQKHQQCLLRKLPVQEFSSLGTNVHARRIHHSRKQYQYETSMRARSLLFIALGVVAASSVCNASRKGKIDFYVPENGFISVNPALTMRRIGSHSTRTTHPHFLSLVQNILDGVNLPVKIMNPYRGISKGAMMQKCKNQNLLTQLAKNTVSCGKWKRKNKQCGRCVPCLIRRSAFHASGISDTTPYQYKSLKKVLEHEGQRDDVLAVMAAIDKYSGKDVKRWSMSNGPLPLDSKERKLRVNAVKDGLAELENFLRASQRIL